MRTPKPIHVGTSGWHYQHWKGPFYPEGLPDDRFLEYYRNHFDTAEVNNTFYRLPEKETFARWRDAVPKGFIFSVKASRYITHMKKLNDAEQPLARFIGTAETLQDRMGPVLFQLPPHWKINIDRLRNFLKVLPHGHRYAFEFRDASWFGRQTEEALAERGCAFCIHDFERRESPHSVTTDFVYIRLHGPDSAYQGKYEDGKLSNWAKSLLSWAVGGKEAYCYFDNDEKGYAAQNAIRLRQLMEKR